jgi:hypothetical protein
VTGLVAEAAGWAGAAALLLAYGLVSNGRLDGRSRGFQLLNLAGAAGLLANGIWHGAWPSAVLNAVWLALGLSALARLRAVSRNEVDASLRRPPA